MLKVRFLNGDYTGGYATLRKEVVSMRNYIKKTLRVIILVIIFLVIFAINAK